MNNITSHLKAFFITAFAIILTACGSTPQPPVTLDTNLLANKDLKIGYVYNITEKKATTHIYGAGCLLCYGVASALTGKLDTHLEGTITNDELINIKNLVSTEYAQHSTITEVTLPSPIKKLKKFKGELGFAKKDFRSLKETLNVDILVILDIYAHGAYRSFSDYVSGLLYAIDLNTNAYTQYLRIHELVQPSGEWDEPTDFPSMTTSYYQAVENVKQKIKDAI